MKKCNLNPDEQKECSCVVKIGTKLTCDITDEQISKLKKCTLKNRKKVKIEQKSIKSFILQYRFLSNFYDSEITYKRKTYPTAEHLFQVLKTKSTLEKERIRSARTPQLAKKFGYGVLLRKDWEEVKDNLMYMIIRLKFLQHQELSQALLKTRDRILIEGNYWHDNYWGDCYCPKCKKIEGQNHLGKILMQVRKLQT